MSRYSERRRAEPVPLVEPLDEPLEGLGVLGPAALRLEHAAERHDRGELVEVLTCGVRRGRPLEVDRLAADLGARSGRREHLHDMSASTPQSSGSCKPSGGGGMNEPLSSKSPAAKPSGAHVAIATSPPGRQTRTSSAAARR